MQNFNLQDKGSKLYKLDLKSTDPEEFHNRLNNYLNCAVAFFELHNTSYGLKQMVQKFDVNRYCVSELNELKLFAKKTDLKYDSVYAYMDKDTTAAILNGMNYH